MLGSTSSDSMPQFLIPEFQTKFAKGPFPQRTVLRHFSHLGEASLPPTFPIHLQAIKNIPHYNLPSQGEL